MSCVPYILYALNKSKIWNNGQIRSFRRSIIICPLNVFLHTTLADFISLHKTFVIHITILIEKHEKHTIQFWTSNLYKSFDRIQQKEKYAWFDLQQPNS